MRIIKYLLLISVFAIIISIFFFDNIISDIKYLYLTARYKFYKNDGTCPNCQIMFTDDVQEHKKAYYNEGIEPQVYNVDLRKLYRNKRLKKLESNDLFYVRNLKYSEPYILPKAYNFIYKICEEYNDSCLNNDIDYIPIVITSVTRTKESVEKLKKINQNAIQESAHLRGKTFDISYKKFGNYNKQLKLFTGILLNNNKNSLCFVKYERNGCLHITVN